jgi:hypothetical protein
MRRKNKEMMISLFAHISAEIKIQQKKNWKRKAQLCQYHRSQLFFCLSFHRFIDIHWYSSVVNLNSLKWQYVLSSRLSVPMQSNWTPIRWDQVLKLLPSSKSCVRHNRYQSPTQLVQIEMLRELKIKKRQRQSAIHKNSSALWVLPRATATKYKTFGYAAWNAI